MQFYQAHGINPDGSKFWCNLRDTPEQALKDLKNRFYEVCAMRSDNGDYPLYDPNRRIGIAVIDI